MEGVDFEAEEFKVAVAIGLAFEQLDLTQNLSPNYQDLSQYPEYRRNTLTNIVDRICYRLGVRTVNLYDVFATHDPEKLFFTGSNDHWNDAGQELAAQRMADYIAENIYGTE